MILAEFTSTAKINLFLDVVGKDPKDSYHFLESIFVEIPWGDDFVILEDTQDSVHFSGLDAEAIGADNTVAKALALFKERFAVSDCFRIEVWKNLPSGSGLGGGSGDAGALLRFLCGRYRKKLIDAAPIAAAVGSDVSFFLTGGSAHVSGKGEKVSPLLNRLEPGLAMLLVCPPVHCSAKEAYGALDGNFNSINHNKLRHFLKKSLWGLDFLKENVYNTFDRFLIGSGGPLEVFHEKIQQAAEPPVIFISGSGSSFVLFYGSVHEAAAAEIRLKKIESGIYTRQIWW